MDPKVSVVVPAYNGQKMLAKNLPKILAMGADEVIVVDDASTDRTAHFITRNFPK